MRKQKARWQRIGLMALAAVWVYLALLMSKLLRFDFDVPARYLSRMNALAPWAVALCLCCFCAFGLYRSAWRYASADSLLQIALATLVSAAGLYVFSRVTFYFTQPVNATLLHRTVYLMFWLMLTALVGGSRLLLRLIQGEGRFFLKRMRGGNLRRVMVVGAGFAGARVVHELRLGRMGNAMPLLLVDDNEERTGKRISGVPVLPDTGRIGEYAKQYDISDIIIAIATPQGEIQPLLERCLKTGCRVRRVTDLQEVETGDRRGKVRDIDISDLLGLRKEHLSLGTAPEYFAGKTVLITGGGGSIGAELCRRLLTMQPERLVLYDLSENYMYDLFFELQEERRESLKDKLILCVGSIRDEQRLGEVLAKYRPQVLLHAAAHKHVPLMEDCPAQAVKNNVFGTYTAAKCAVAAGVERFVMISTDKAVNPTNIMGASKRLAEIVIEAMNGLRKTEFVAVRFGNVLGSHGSVVPLFERQIRAGGPVTLTHPDIIRYFMTIPEAASLVLQAAALAKGGELFVLDMGRPVKIRELAERMIQLATAQGAAPVEIVYTGLRPGEKLYEELLTSSEGLSRTERDQIFVAKPDIPTMDEMRRVLDSLQACLDEGGDMRACMHRLLPEFREPDEVNREAKMSHEAQQAQAAEV